MPIGRIAQLSDFHFVRQLTHEKRAFYKKGRAKGHCFSRLVALARQMDRLERLDGRFDAVLCTGDLATDGSPAALATCLSYIENEEVRAGEPSQAYTLGLNASAQRRLLLPGNHDRWTRKYAGFQVQGAAFERALGLPTEYPYVVGLRGQGTANEPDESAILFFVFDSTPGVFVNFWWWDRLARGRLEHGALDSFMRKARAIQDDGIVRNLGGGADLRVRYSNCVRVALLHHHPFDRHGTTLMENSTEFKEFCTRAGIHVVLFGHEHKEYRAQDFGASELAPDPNHQTVYFCCPSASEYSSAHGFYEFTFDSIGFDFTFHKWRNMQFEPGGIDENSFLPGAPQRYPFSRTLQ